MNLRTVLILVGFLNATACAPKSDNTPTPPSQKTVTLPSPDQAPNPDVSAPIPSTENPNDTPINTPIDTEQLVHLKKSKRIWINLQGNLSLSDGGDANALTWTNEINAEWADITWSGNTFSFNFDRSEFPHSNTDITMVVIGQVAQDGASLLSLRATQTIITRLSNKTNQQTTFSIELESFPLRQWRGGSPSDLGASLSGIVLQKYIKSVSYKNQKNCIDGLEQSTYLQSVDYPSSTLTLYFGQQ
ncbi:MAG: hypothetical protein BroJett040_22290 [Oligoflexia bacterium]|nr:MAG: hypothetical protein BroJett040_22290 [Oligoflexia bacterium]